jgi:hypothetical protein
MPKKAVIKSSVLSARVPVDVMSTIDKICESKQISRSEWVTSAVVAQQADAFYSKGGSIQTRTIPKEVENLLLAAGTTTVGILSYNIISNLLEKEVDNGIPKYNQGEVQFISLVTSLAIAMVGFGMMKSLTDD